MGRGSGNDFEAGTGSLGEAIQVKHGRRGSPGGTGSGRWDVNRGPEKGVVIAASWVPEAQHRAHVEP